MKNQKTGKKSLAPLPEPSCRDGKNKPVAVRAVPNPAPDASFGFASQCFEIDAKTLDGKAFLSIPVHEKALAALELDPLALRLFIWSKETGSFALLPGSEYDFAKQAVIGQIMGRGVYVVIGRSRNPWIAATANLIEQAGPFLKIEAIRGDILKSICQVILCRNGELSEKLRGAEGLSELSLPSLPGGLGNACERCLRLDLPFGRLPEHAILPNPPTPIPTFYLDNWLQDRPAIANAIVWEPAVGIAEPYPRWSRAQKADLAGMFDLIRRGGSPELPDAPPFMHHCFDSRGGLFGVMYDSGLAWRYFVAYVAQSLAVEIERQVLWSLETYDEDALHWLFHSNSLFSPHRGLTLGELEDGGPEGHVIWSRQHVDWNIRSTNEYPAHGCATPGDPARIFNLLRGMDALSPTRRETIVGVLDWCSPRLRHHGRTGVEGISEPERLWRHWQYEGWAPVERTLAGTELHYDDDIRFRGHWTYGCWGTTALLRTLLRTANIPVKPIEGGCHMAPYFILEGVALAHGDDAYGIDREIPREELFIDETKIRAWFGPELDYPEFCKNVGRRIYELWEEYLPLSLLRTHCEDIENGRAPRESTVLALFSYGAGPYSLEELTERGLWSRLDAKLAEIGGCAEVERRRAALRDD